MKMLRPALFAVIACALPALSLAQWQWIDKSGRKVFSDQAPPADIPAKNILKQPGGARAPAAAPVAEAPASAAAPATPAGNIPKLSGKDKALEEKKKQAEAAEAEKKKAEQEKYAKQKEENCARAKQSKATLDSGVRISRTNAKGEREILDDAARAKETQWVQEIINRDCAK